jgi:hypothetical protein
LIPLDVVKSRAFVGSTCPGARAKGTSCWACESSGYGGEKLSELLGIHDDRMVLSSLSLRVLTILVGDYWICGGSNRGAIAHRKHEQL